MTADSSRPESLTERLFWPVVAAYTLVVLVYGFSFAFTPGFGETIWFSVSSMVLVMGLYVALVAGGKVPVGREQIGSFSVDRRMAIGALILIMTIAF